MKSVTSQRKPLRMTLHHDGRDYPVDVLFSRRRTFGIVVHRDLRVTARAPLRMSMPEIQAGLDRRAGWVAKHVKRFETLPPVPPPPRFDHGEHLQYLGRPLQLVLTAGEKPAIRLLREGDGDRLHLTLPDPADTATVEALVQTWYGRTARRILTERMARFVPAFAILGGPEPVLKFRRMKRRWGSCSRKGVILLNTELIKSSPECIDYVLVHELCHLFHLNHSREFYALLTRMMPDWKDRRAKLNGLVC